jgi:di/tricarboxylate transporter
MAGALLMVLCRVLTEKEAIQALPMSLIFIFVGALATGKALIYTGAGDFLGGLLASVTGNTKSNLLIGVIAYVIPYLLTQVLLNSGVSALVRPIILLICASLGANPVGPMILMLSATVSSFMSPMATPVVPACMELGGFSTKTLVRQGWWISVILAAVQILWVMHIFPAF